MCYQNDFMCLAVINKLAPFYPNILFFSHFFQRIFKFHLKYQGYTEQKENNVWKKGRVKFMRKKYIILLLCTALALSLCNGCGGTEKGIKSHSQEFRNEEDTVYGEVSKITEDSITINVGTQKKNAQPDENSSMLELTGEAKEIQITENPIIKRRTMGNRVGKTSENEQPPEQPNEEVPSGELPEQPNGEVPSGEPPERSSEKDFPRDHTQEISISDISEGDSVRVLFAEDGSTKEITIISAFFDQTEKSSPLV